jgi:MFS family permease
LISNYTWRTSYIILGVADIVIITTAALFLRRSPLRDLGSSTVTDKNKIRVIPQETSGYSFKQSFTTRYFWLMAILFFCFGITVGTIQLHIVPHATDINISSIAAAGILSTISGAGIAGSIGLGSLADRIGNKWLFIMTFIIEVVALLWLIFTQQLWGLYLFAVVYGLAYGSGLAQQSPFTAKIFGMRSHGAILGVLNLSQTVAGGVGGILAGYIFDITGSYQLMFTIVAILCLIGLFATVLVKPLKDSNKEMAVE